MELEILERYQKAIKERENNSYFSICGNQITLNAVITKDVNKALSVMKEKGANRQTWSSTSIKWGLNGEIWIWKDWNVRCRGYRFDKIIVDQNIDYELFIWIATYSWNCNYLEIIY